MPPGTTPNASPKKPANARLAVRELMAAAVEPLSWEIQLLQAIPEARDRVLELKERKLLSQVSSLTALADQEIYIDLISKAAGISVAAVEDLLTQCEDLYKELTDIFGPLREVKDPRRVAEHIYKWFDRQGGKFYKTSDDQTWLFFHGRQYRLENNIAFNALMDKMTRLSAIERPGSVVWYFLQTICFNHGEPIDMVRWIYTDRESDAVYVNLNSPHHKIVKIAAGTEPEVLDNGTNEQSVLLSSSPQIRPFEYQPAAVEAEGFRALKTLLMDTTPCERPQKYFYICWLITAFLVDYQGDRGLLQIIANTKIGKSKVAERSSQLIFGVNLIGKGTGAAETRIAANSPLVFQDNLENRNLTQATVDLLLFMANSAHKPKSKSGSDTEVLYQQLNTLAMITSIEAFPGKRAELINRTFPLILEPRYKIQGGYMHDEVMRQIGKDRNLILSSVFKMIGRCVLPKLAERTDWSKYIHTKYAGHHKDRMNEHLCMMLLVLEGVLEHIPWSEGDPIKKQAGGVLDQWISFQEEQAHQTAVTSNTLLNLMDGLAKELWIKIRGKMAEGEGPPFIEMPKLFSKTDNKDPDSYFAFEDPEYMETFYLSEPVDDTDPSEDDDVFVEKVHRLEFVLTAADLYRVFNYFCKNQHIRNPFENPTALGARLSNDMEVMKKGGWTYVSHKDQPPQFKKIKGIWNWRLYKTIPVR